MKNHRLHRFKPQITQIIVLVFSLWFLVFDLSGCAALRKKFVRKPKKEKEKQEEVVYVPEKYPEYQFSSNELYVMHFSFWQHWHNELINRFEPGENKKKWLSCIEEEIKNLQLMKDLLKSEDKKFLIDTFVEELNSLSLEINDISVSDMYKIKTEIERLGREIHQQAAYSKIKEDLIKPENQ